VTSSEFLGRVPIQHALARQEQIRAAAELGGRGFILGFECEPVVTLGVRAGTSEVAVPDLHGRGFDLVRVDRGGQATLHNPGQLVIFPVLNAGRLNAGCAGAKNWVCLLIHATQSLAERLGHPLQWDAQNPGLYDGQGKVVSVGVRLRKGISTHGIAINIHNDLAPFGWIRACGRSGASMSRLPSELTLLEVFQLWLRCFDAEVDKARNLAQVRGLTSEVRL
jgi:lipoyl(octanoyl) transferase